VPADWWSAYNGAVQDERTLGLLIGGLGPIAVACALVPLRDQLNNANVALAMVVVVVLAGITGGTGAGALAAVIATLSFDFFHTEPYLSLTINSQDDIETTVLLLAVGLLVGAMASRAGRARASAALGRSELRRIHGLSELVSAGATAADVIMAAQEQLTQLLRLRSCRFEAPPYAERRPRLERSGVIAGQTQHRMTRGGFELPAEGVELAVLARGREVGRFVMVPQPEVGVSLDERVVAVALADQVGAALAGGPPSSPAIVPEGNTDDA
jgi:hypothetical protein